VEPAKQGHNKFCLLICWGSCQLPDIYSLLSHCC